MPVFILVQTQPEVFLFQCENSKCVQYLMPSKISTMEQKNAVSTPSRLLLLNSELFCFWRVKTLSDTRDGKVQTFTIGEGL